MDLHPIIVHIPVACLGLYTIVEIISRCKKINKENLLMTKYFLLFVGVIGAFIALQSGEIAEHLMGGHSNLVETHSTFANLTHFAYMIIAVIYALSLILKNNIGQKYRPTFVNNKLPQIMNFLTHQYTHIAILILSIIGFGLLGITGALGGAIAHGTSDDPISAWAVNTFVGQ